MVRYFVRTLLISRLRVGDLGGRLNIKKAMKWCRHLDEISACLESHTTAVEEESKVHYLKLQPIKVAPVSVERTGGEIREMGWGVANALIAQLYPKISGVIS